MKILTKKRKEILDLLQSSEKPMCANMLKKHVTFNLSTIYRALEYLESNNFISSFYFGNEKYYFKEKNGNFFLYRFHCKLFGKACRRAFLIGVEFVSIAQLPVPVGGLLQGLLLGVNVVADQPVAVPVGIHPGLF